MNNNKTIRIGIVIVAAIAAMMLIGPNLTYMQSYATSPHGKTAKGAFNEARSSITHKSQHLNQENLCYRTIDCRNSNVAQQIIGNDNSVTGFADQSSNNSTGATAGAGLL
jgi:archaellin